ncbi:MAG TPA: acyl-CoA dehydrogenase family protein, partial [Microthrixaceae bacterium]|nr:acyl-CoA dehydrogenase family protein [Microthrixaceae bacterium]
IQQMIADNEIDIAATRAITKMASEVIDTGAKGSAETSMAKTFSAEAINRVVDRSLQICGSLGVSRDVLLSRYYQEVRPFRIYDGPSETHRWSIAKRAFRAAEARRS